MNRFKTGVKIKLRKRDWNFLCSVCFILFGNQTKNIYFNDPIIFEALCWIVTQQQANSYLLFVRQLQPSPPGSVSVLLRAAGGIILTDWTHRGIIFQSTSHWTRLLSTEPRWRGRVTLLLLWMSPRRWRAEQGHPRGSSQPGQEQEGLKYGSNIYLRNVAAVMVNLFTQCCALFVLFVFK